jgi:epoxyqueuosine reductase
MGYLDRGRADRLDPARLLPGCRSVVAVAMSYNPDATADDDWRPVSRYARGRDYHDVIRPRLVELGEFIGSAAGGNVASRAAVDSSAVLERDLAARAGLGWVGKNTNLLAPALGSYFFIGIVLTTAELPFDQREPDRCGTCTACLDACPTRAFVAPYVLDARRCISYLTIEQRGAIPLEMRAAVGNRIFGCDDCQLYCPWNKFARATEVADFAVRHDLDGTELVRLFAWTEVEWRERTAGSALRRAGYDGWLRNVAVALGNAPTEPVVIDALRSRSEHPSNLVREHVRWALARHAAI